MTLETYSVFLIPFSQLSNGHSDKALPSRYGKHISMWCRQSTYCSKILWPESVLTDPMQGPGSPDLEDALSYSCLLTETIFFAFSIFHACDVCVWSAYEWVHAHLCACILIASAFVFKSSRFTLISSLCNGTVLTPDNPGPHAVARSLLNHVCTGLFQCHIIKGPLEFHLRNVDIFGGHYFAYHTEYTSGPGWAHCLAPKPSVIITSKYWYQLYW